MFIYATLLITIDIKTTGKVISEDFLKTHMQS